MAKKTKWTNQTMGTIHSSPTRPLVSCAKAGVRLLLKYLVGLQEQVRKTAESKLSVK